MFEGEGLALDPEGSGQRLCQHQANCSDLLKLHLFFSLEMIFVTEV